MDSVNLKKLSSILGLSVSTVSKALRDSYEISEETKERVKKIAKAYNYQPNIYASSLRKAKSKTIAVIVPRIANNFFISAIDGIQEVAQEKKYHVLIYLSHESYEYEKELVQSFASGRVDGMLISLTRETNDMEHLRQLVNNGIPVVFFDRVSTELDCSTVSTNDYESAFEATEHLIKAGCKKIAHCRISNKLSIGQHRLNGYRDALEKHNLDFHSKYVVKCSDNDVEDYKTIKTLLKDKDRPDGLFTAVESYTLIAYEVCRELGIKIPQDLKLITFSNLRTAGLLDPSLTTITQPAFEIGEKAAAELISAIEKPRYFKPENIILKSVLSPRDSTN
ncbi:MAG: LacI family transcriptional regulator [Sphingobacteriales bacterium 41-5]|nr:MAG: LacI family transcriptional regulator [Sphingobacteriales bacterium 41-5]